MHRLELVIIQCVYVRVKKVKWCPTSRKPDVEGGPLQKRTCEAGGEALSFVRLFCHEEETCVLMMADATASRA